MHEFFGDYVNDFCGPYRSIKRVIINNLGKLYPRFWYVLNIRYRKKFNIRYKMIHNLNIEYSNFECVICKFSVGLYCPIKRYRKLMKIHLGMDNLIIL